MLRRANQLLTAVQCSWLSQQKAKGELRRSTLKLAASRRRTRQLEAAEAAAQPESATTQDAAEAAAAAERAAAALLEEEQAAAAAAGKKERQRKQKMQPAEQQQEPRQGQRAAAEAAEAEPAEEDELDALQLSRDSSMQRSVAPPSPAPQPALAPSTPSRTSAGSANSSDDSSSGGNWQVSTRRGRKAALPPLPLPPLPLPLPPIPRPPSSTPTSAAATPAMLEGQPSSGSSSGSPAGAVAGLPSFSKEAAGAAEGVDEEAAVDELLQHLGIAGLGSQPAAVGGSAGGSWGARAAAHPAAARLAPVAPAGTARQPQAVAAGIAAAGSSVTSASNPSSCPLAGLPSALLSELHCPITHEPMNDPVVAADGASYERSAIQGAARFPRKCLLLSISLERYVG